MQKAESSATFVVVALSLLLAGCAATAEYHSHGRTYAPVVARAIRCDQDSATTLVALGGEAIGTVEASGASTDTPVDEVVSEAAAVAAKNGATHIVLATDGAEVNAAQKIRGRYVAFRVPVEAWAQLPGPLRPQTNR